MNRKKHLSQILSEKKKNNNSNNNNKKTRTKNPPVLLGIRIALPTIGSFHVMSYQANFASHKLATAMLVSCSHVMVLGKATKYSITFYLVHTTLPNYNRVTRLSAHTLA